MYNILFYKFYIYIQIDNLYKLCKKVIIGIKDKID